MKPMPLIAVADVQASARFYSNLLGAVTGHGGDEYEQLLVEGQLVLQLHDTRPDASHGPLRDQAVQPGNGVILWFETGDFQAQLHRLRVLGATPEREPARNPYSGALEVWLRDPDGYQVVIAEQTRKDKQVLQHPAFIDQQP
ncbi:MAG: VOC family protein [Clostridiales bacterium]|nr:VOC family protein [Clostridiales bacterium]